MLDETDEPHLPHIEELGRNACEAILIHVGFDLGRSLRLELLRALLGTDGHQVEVLDIFEDVLWLQESLLISLAHVPGHIEHLEIS